MRNLGYMNKWKLGYPGGWAHPCVRGSIVLTGYKQQGWTSKLLYFLYFCLQNRRRVFCYWAIPKAQFLKRGTLLFCYSKIVEQFYFIIGNRAFDVTQLQGVFVLFVDKSRTGNVYFSVLHGASSVNFIFAESDLRRRKVQRKKNFTQGGRNGLLDLKYI